MCSIWEPSVLLWLFCKLKINLKLKFYLQMYQIQHGIKVQMQLLYWSLPLKHIFMEVTAKWPWFCKSVCYTWFLVQTEPIVSTFSKAKQTWAVCQNRQVACYPQCDSAIQIFPFHDTQYSLWSGQGKRSKLILHWLEKFPNASLWGDVRNSHWGRAGRKRLLV